MPPPTEKIRTPIFLQFGACPDFSCRDTLRTRSGSVSRKFWVAPLAKNQDTILPAVSRRVPIFFQETAAGVCPENFGYPPPPFRGGSRGVRGSRCSPGLFLLVSSNTPFILLKFFHVTGGGLILKCTKCSRQINCDVATSCYLLFQNNKNRKRRWIIQNGLLNVSILATGFDFQNGKEQF